MNDDRHHSPAHDYLGAAVRLTLADVPDDVAVAELVRIAADRSLLESAVSLAARRRSNFLWDRAFRLLSAALEGGPVKPIPPAFADLFEEEARLGRMPLQEAFAYLATREPGLLELRDHPPKPEAPRRGLMRHIGLRVTKTSPYDAMRSELVGVRARSRKPILMSDIASAVVEQYMLIKAGRLTGDLSEPYFGKAQIVTMSVASSGFKRQRGAPDA